jgi:hypothetical protein
MGIQLTWTYLLFIHCKDSTKHIDTSAIQGDSRVIMSLMKFVITLLVHYICTDYVDLKNIYFNFIQHNQHSRHYVCQIYSKSRGIYVE